MSAIRNVPAPGAPYFTPQQSPVAGTALSENAPRVFQPITLRGTTFQNRIWVAPMCMYSANNGYITDFHFQHYSAFAYRGASLTIVEATAVRPEGRITPEDVGLWEDGQIAPIRRLADFVHSQGQKLGIQLAHAGRKASTVAPWLMTQRGQAILATEEVGGWPNAVKGMSAIQWDEHHAMPKEMTKEDIQDVVTGFRDSARRAVEAGVDVIEVHSAHGYLLCSSLSPLTNQRTDSYGGSFENRTRMLVEVLEAVRDVIPQEMPLVLRVSGTEWMENSSTESWTVNETIRLAKMLPALGVDLLDVSSGGNHSLQAIDMFGAYQIGLASEIRAALRSDGINSLQIGCVGLITEADAAKEALEQDGAFDVTDEQNKPSKADVVLIGRQFLREPEWVLRIAQDLGVSVKWPQQYGYATASKVHR